MNINGNSITIQKNNGIIVSLFVFQYSLLIPLMQYVSRSLLVGASGILLLGVTFFINRRIAINKRIAFVIAVISVLMLVKVIYDQSDPKVFLNFLMITICRPYENG